MKRTCCLLLLFFTLFVLLSGCSGSSTISNIQEALDPTTATDKLITVHISLDGETGDIEGYYTGDIQNGQAHGYGTYISENNDGSFTYKGYFSNGQINGEGVMKLLYDGGELRYEGNFINGALNGYGSTIATEGGVTTARRGNYSQGRYTPTVGQKYDYLGQMDFYGVFSLPDSVISYIDSHPEYFPKADKPDAEAAILREFEYRHFTKTRKQDTIGLIKTDLYPIQVQENVLAETGDTITTILANDEAQNIYVLYYLDSVEIYDGDIFTAYSLPVELSSYSNVSGGTTIAVDMIASYIQITN